MPPRKRPTTSAPSEHVNASNVPAEALQANPLEMPESGAEESNSEDAEAGTAATGEKRKRAAGGQGRRRTAGSYITDKKKRGITFSKRKAGIFTKARELSTLTGSSLLLLVVSETGIVYQFCTEKFQPLVSQPAGKGMIAACLNGTVTLDEASSSTATEQAKRGGNIILRDAFGKDDDTQDSPLLPFPPTMATLASPPLPEPSKQSWDSHHSFQDFLQMTGLRYPANSQASSLSQLSPPHDPPYRLPDMPVPLPSFHSGQNRNAPLPERREASAPVYHIHAAPSHATVSNPEVSDAECESRLLPLRRSLSIERRFENTDDVGRPLQQTPDDRAAHASAGRGEDDPVAQQYTRRHAQALQEFGVPPGGFSHVADSWASINNKYFKPEQTSVQATSSHRISEASAGVPKLWLPALNGSGGAQGRSPDQPGK